MLARPPEQGLSPLRWYVAKVKARNERRVGADLALLGIQVFGPELLVVKGGKQRTEPLFPGYVFINVDSNAATWAMVKWAHGISYILPDSDCPAPVSNDLVSQIEARLESWNSGGWAEAFQRGDKVVLEGGPLSNLDAIFQRYIPGKQRCEVLVSLMGRPHNVAVNITDLPSVAIKRRFAEARPAEK